MYRAEVFPWEWQSEKGEKTHLSDVLFDGVSHYVRVQVSVFSCDKGDLVNNGLVVHGECG